MARPLTWGSAVFHAEGDVEWTEEDAIAFMERVQQIMRDPSLSPRALRLASVTTMRPMQQYLGRIAIGDDTHQPPIPIEAASHEDALRRLQEHLDREGRTEAQIMFVERAR